MTDYIPEFIQAWIGGARFGFADMDAVQTEYIEALTRNPNLTPEQAFREAYTAALEAAKERVA